MLGLDSDIHVLKSHTVFHKYVQLCFFKQSKVDSMAQHIKALATKPKFNTQDPHGTAKGENLLPKVIL